MRRWTAVPMITLCLVACSSPISAPAAHTIAEFETQLDALKSQYHVPGMSAIVDGPGGTVWEHAYGYADIAKQTPVTSETLFHLASLTKPFAAVVAFQLVQEGKLGLDTTAAYFGIAVPAPDSVRIRHLMSHTSESHPPGSAYHYNGSRYGLISAALFHTSDKTFAELFGERIRAPLGLTATMPNPLAPVSVAQSGADAGLSLRLTQGYSDNGTTPVAYENYFGPAAGLIASPRDIVKFSRALDEDVLLTRATRDTMWTPVRTPDGKTLPYAYGWFVQKYAGETVVWHYGLWTGASALIVKVPARRLTFVVLGNSPNLSMPFPLGDGDLTTSPFAMLFLKSFVNGPLSSAVK